MKTEIYHLIVLDESGSMSGIRMQTIDGCNETINTIRVAQEKFGETQDHFVSIFAFQSGGSKPSRYLIKNQPIAEVQQVTEKDYKPEGMTPLYDAVGGTLTDLKAVVKSRELAIGSVTIITDGMENDSEHYTLEKVSNMIEALKEVGWNFNFIGANIDVKEVATSLHIDNMLAFEQDEAGTKEMFRRERRAKMGFLKRTNCEFMACRAPELTEEEEKEFLKKCMRNAQSDYYEESRGADDDE